jgi:hypothetical protein
MYPVIILTWTIYSLIGWRVTRRFGWRGEVVFLAAVSAIGTLRDYQEAGRGLGIITLRPGMVTVLVDVVCWLGLTALAQGVMFLISGPSDSDPLALHSVKPSQPRPQ